jgi:hypothetical protein
MVTFAGIQPEQTTGQLSMFDRIIFKGHLTSLYPQGNFSWFLRQQGVLLKEFGPYAKASTEQVKAHAQAMAQEAGRPYQYLAGAKTQASGQSKEAIAREIAERDGVTEGLICVLATLELSSSFDIRGNHQTKQKEVIRRQRKCLHIYFYYLDREFGLMHIRLQSWFPFEIQVYINGREWLARQLDLQGIAYERYDNCLLRIDDLATAQQLCDRFGHREWARVLNAFARRVNPMLPTIEQSGFSGYYWVINQCEIATDLMFKDRTSLTSILPDLFQEAILAFSAEDVMRFLGRKLHGNFQGDVTTDLKKRPEGRRVKHRSKGNSIKMYDKASVLRIETTINNSREFKVLKTEDDGQRRWKPMGKGVSNFWRFYQVGQQANQRYLTALAHIQLKGEGVQALDDLCRSRTKHGKRFAKFNPVSRDDCALFAAAMAGDHVINGFRNRDLRAHLYATSAKTSHEARRRCARVSRLIAKLRGHGLIAKVQGSRLYRVTKRGYQIMAAALSFRLVDFPNVYWAA